jgi:hypothetical protein
VENPISLYEALARPFKNLIKMMNAKIEEIKSMAESKLGTVVTEQKLNPAQQQPQTTAAPQGQPQGMGNFLWEGVLLSLPLVPDSHLSLKPFKRFSGIQLSLRFSGLSSRSLSLRLYPLL